MYRGVQNKAGLRSVYGYACRYWVTGVQIPNEAVCVTLHAIAFRKGMNLFLYYHPQL